MPEISPRRQLPKDVMSDEKKQRALYQNICSTNTLNLTPAWYLNNSRYPERDGNAFKVYISGEDVFGDIAHSILHAKKSVDIVCTFYDPAMLLTRNRPLLPGDPPDANKVNYSNRDDDDLYSAWSERDSFGGIIIEALKRNPELQIRLVIWLHETAQMGSNNVIGIDRLPKEDAIPHNEGATGFDIRQIPDPDPNKWMPESWGRDKRKYESLKLRSRTATAANYSKQWFQRVTWEVEDKTTGRHSLFDRLCITRRAITTPWLIKDEDMRFLAEQRSLEFGCDHQKTVLVDLDDADNPRSDPHGYVLGHNYFTQYWSHFPFVHRDPRSEMDYLPYHDFSMQIRGPLLIDLNHNFCQAYGLEVPAKDCYKNAASMQRLGILTEGRVENPLIYDGDSLPNKDPNVYYNIGDTPTDGRRYSRAAYKRAVRTLENEIPQELYNKRTTNIALLKGLLAKRGNASGQVVRTRPDQELHGAQEKEIKDAYLQVVRHATNFILLVNQYFQYNKLARQIKHWKNESNIAFQNSPSCNGREPRTLYLFLGTCKSEKDGMVFRTQQMANEFGVGDQLDKAYNEMYNKNKVDDNGVRQRTRFGLDMDAEPHITLDAVEELHIKPLFFMFYTQIPPEEQRKNPADHVAQQVYVHAKLMIEDDSFFTLGSSNTNIRSFAVDSELNIISDDKETAIKTRYDLLKEYVGEIQVEFGEVFSNIDGETLTQDNLESIYKIMKKRMQDNYRLIFEKKRINGLVARFHDDRSSNVVRVA